MNDFLQLNNKKGKRKIDIGISTSLFQENRLSVQDLELIKDYGIDKIEIAGFVPSHFNHDDLEHIEQIRKSLKRLKMKAYSYHAPFSPPIKLFCTDGSRMINKKNDEDIIRLKKVIDAASTLDVKILVVHTNVDEWSPPNDDRWYDCVWQHLDPLVDYCRQKHIVFAIEKTINPLNKWVIKVLDRYDRKEAGYVLDTGHAHLRYGVPKVHELAKDYIVHLHVTDALILGNKNIDWEKELKDKIANWDKAFPMLKETGVTDHIIPFEGEIDWIEFVRKLKRDQYQGIFMYEMMGSPFKKKRQEVLKKIVESFQRMGNSA